MKVFLSWSGSLSREIASALQEWLPSVIQTVEPFLSSDSIFKGTRWGHELGVALEESSFGIICLTRENLDSPWISFEAGALSKSLSSGRVCPFLIDVSRDGLSGPLSQFQNTTLTKDDLLKLVSAINAASGAQSVEHARLAKAFDMWWPDLEAKVNSILASHHEKRDKHLDEQPSSRTFKLLTSRGTLINPADQSRNIAFKVETINRILETLGKELERNTDQATAHQAFFAAGYGAGRQFGERILEKWELDHPTDSIIDRINRWCDFDSDVGWGRLTNDLRVDESQGQISGSIMLLDNFQTYKRGERECPDCSLMFGYIKGVLEKLCRGIHLSVECNRQECPLTNPFKRDCIFRVSIKGDQ